MTRAHTWGHFMRHSTVHDPARRRPITRFGAILTTLACGVGFTACSVDTGPSAGVSPPAVSPHTSAPPEPLDPAEPLSSPVAGLTWADGTPVIATTILVASATPATGVETLGTTPTDVRVGYSLAGVASDGAPLLNRMATQELATGGNDTLAVWDGEAKDVFSSVTLLGKGGRQVVSAVTDGATVVWHESSGDQGGPHDWFLLAGNLNGSGDVRLLASSDDLWPSLQAEDLITGDLTIANDRVYFTATHPDGGAHSPWSLLSVPIGGGDVRLDLTQAYGAVPTGDGVVVARTIASQDGYPAGRLDTATSLDLVTPGGSTSTLVHLTHDPGAQPFNWLTGSDRHVTLLSAGGFVVLDLETQTAQRFVPDAGDELGGLVACADRVIWGSSPAEGDSSEAGGESGDDPAAVFVLTPSTGEVRRLATTPPTEPAGCGDDVVLLQDFVEGTGIVHALRVPR